MYLVYSFVIAPSSYPQKLTQKIVLLQLNCYPVIRVKCTADDFGFTLNRSTLCCTTDTPSNHRRPRVSDCSSKDLEQSAAGSDVITTTPIF